MRDCFQVAGFICNPYSGVAQPQAARIARVVADGLSRFQSPASAPHWSDVASTRLSLVQDAGSASPSSVSNDTRVESPAAMQHCSNNMKEENTEEAVSTDTPSTPLDLSVK